MNTVTELLKKPLSLRAAVGYKNIVWGVSLILMAVSYSFNNEVFQTIIAAIALVMSILVFGTSRLKSEAKDEMYAKHIGYASELTLGILMILILMFGFFDNTIMKVFTMKQVLYSVAGFGGILYGTIFIALEKAEE